jgi:UDP-glucuronate 4-epimerase
MPTQTVLVTGAAGFIGFYVAQRLLAQGREVVGVDSVNNYYDPALKEARLALLARDPKFAFVKLDLADRAATEKLFAQRGFAQVVHLAAQAGVRRLCRCQSAGLYQRAGGLPASTCCSHLHRRSTAPIQSCRSQCTTMSIIP